MSSLLKSHSTFSGLLTIDGNPSQLVVWQIDIELWMTRESLKAKWKGTKCFIAIAKSTDKWLMTNAIEFSYVADPWWTWQSALVSATSSSACNNRINSVLRMRLLGLNPPWARRGKKREAAEQMSNKNHIKRQHERRRNWICSKKYKLAGGKLITLRFTPPLT